MTSLITRTGLHAALTGVLLAGTVLAAEPAFAAAEGAAASWRPKASERLIKLPSHYLKKAIDQDFAGSGLAQAIGDANRQIQEKTQTLADLQDAIAQAEGEVATELKHQFLAEKREFIVLNGDLQDLKRKHLKTKVRFYERLIRKIDRSGANVDPRQAQFMENHAAARERFESSVAKVDMKLFNTTVQGESKYSTEYSKNVQAIEALVKAINSHPLAQKTDIEGKPKAKKEYLQALIIDTQSELALVDQEETILGYMAKLVALDAMSLSEEVATLGFEDGDVPVDESESVTTAVEFFVGN